MNRFLLTISGSVAGIGTVVLTARHSSEAIILLRNIEELAHAGIPAVLAVALLIQVIRTAIAEIRGQRPEWISELTQSGKHVPEKHPES